MGGLLLVAGALVGGAGGTAAECVAEGGGGGRGRGVEATIVGRAGCGCCGRSGRGRSVSGGLFDTAADALDGGFAETTGGATKAGPALAEADGSAGGDVDAAGAGPGTAAVGEELG